MIKFLLSEFVTWIIVTPVVFYAYLLYYNAGKPEGFSSLFDELYYYTLFSILFVFPVPLFVSLAGNRFLRILNKYIFIIYSPIIYVSLFSILIELEYIVVEKLWHFYYGYPYYYVWFLLTAIFSYCVVYFFSREKH